MLEIVDSVPALMQSVTEKGRAGMVTERMESRELGVAMQRIMMVESVPVMTEMFQLESVPVVDAMAGAKAKSHPGTMAEAATSRLDRQHDPSQDQKPDKEGECNSSHHTLPERCAVDCAGGELGAMPAPVPSLRLLEGAQISPTPRVMSIG